MRIREAESPKYQRMVAEGGSERQAADGRATGLPAVSDRALSPGAARAEHVVWSGRCVGKKNMSLTERARLALLGMPGAGKSHCLHLLRDFFGSCMQWTDGVQYQFLATQNTMAELIGGKTANTWGVIPPNKTAAAAKMHGAKDVDRDQLFENAFSIRWSEERKRVFANVCQD